ncbi:MAG: hypothetical protein H0W68_08745 [Gemmatimonadaceae bacterium]|nr:hypothetical protein [Geodermatophilaceae bacterium]MBA3672092.1 hypothetical protein [Gemmatimonadaceae bacterium]
MNKRPHRALRAERRDDPPRRRRSLAIWVAIGTIVLAGGIAVVWRSLTPPPPVVAEESPVVAELKARERLVEACAGYVREKLGDPTARLILAGKREESILPMGGPQWRVLGYYTKTGAPPAARRPYVCDVQVIFGGFRLIAITL